MSDLQNPELLYILFQAGAQFGEDGCSRISRSADNWFAREKIHFDQHYQSVSIQERGFLKNVLLAKQSNPYKCGKDRGVKLVAKKICQGEGVDNQQKCCFFEFDEKVVVDGVEIYIKQ